MTKRIKLWPHATLIVLGFAAVAAIAAAVWMRYEGSTAAKELPNAARIERVDGQVGVKQGSDDSNSEWVAAKTNTPITEGDRVYTQDNSSSRIAFTGRNFATIDPNTSLDILDLSPQRTQVALRNGTGLFEVGSLASGDLFEVATPCGAVDLQKTGVYQVSIDENGNAVANAFSGEAQIISQTGTSSFAQGDSFTISCAGDSQAAVSRIDYEQAGTVLDNYYRTSYPRSYDGRYRNYSAYLSDPYYYEPSRRYASYNYVSEYVPGIDDLDDYGDWQYVSDYGYCWHPRVDTGWAPYQSGAWSMDSPYGLTWVSDEPWGYAPYHYGRWANASNEWFWVPDRRNYAPSYSPALVAFISFNDNNVGWVPLGPGDPYTPRYYDTNWQPVYPGRRDVVLNQVVNLNVPGAVTMVPAQQFGRGIDRGLIARFDPQAIARVRPVLDPLTLDPLRRAAFSTRESRARFNLPTAAERRFLNRPVVASFTPPPLRGRRDVARDLRVQALPDRVKDRSLQIADRRGAANERRGNDQPPNLGAEQARERQIADLARQASRGDRGARQQMQELRRQQFEQQRAERVNVQQAQGERVRQQMQQQQVQRDALRQQQQIQREAARQQTLNTRQQGRAAQQQQIQIQREQRRQAETRTPPAVRSNERSQTIRSLAPRQPPQFRPPAQPRVVAPQQPQMRQPPPQMRPQPQPQMRTQPVRPQPQAPKAAPQTQRQVQPRPPAPAKPQGQPGPPAGKGKGKKP